MARTKKKETQVQESEAAVAPEAIQEGQDAAQTTNDTTPPPEATEGQETHQGGQEPPEAQEGTAPDPEAPPEDEAPEPEPQPVTPDTPTPCEATVTAALAILRKQIGPGTAEQLRPVATLKKGTKVRIRVIAGEDAQLVNGLWTKTAFLSV